MQSRRAEWRERARLLIEQAVFTPYAAAGDVGPG
jgi:hypothetical protein